MRNKCVMVSMCIIIIITIITLNSMLKSTDIEVFHFNWYWSIPFQLINWNNHRSRIWQWIFYVRRLRTMVHVLISKALNFCSLKPYLFYLWIIIFCEGIPPYKKNCLLYEIMTDWWSFVGCPSGQNLTSPIMSARFCK